MTAFGILLYLLAVGLGFLIWRQIAGASMDELFERGVDEHHRVQQVMAEHPRGGSWREHGKWMRQAGEE